LLLLSSVARLLVVSCSWPMDWTCLQATVARQRCRQTAERR